MQKNRLLAAVIALVCLAAYGCAAVSAPVSASGAAGVSAVDMLGREVTLFAPAKRIAVLSAGDCEILCALGLESSIVGRGEFCDYPEGTAEIPALTSGENTNVEQLIALQPELVILSILDNSDSLISTLEAAGIATAVTDADDINGVYEAAALIGALTGTSDEAASLIAGMRASFEALKSKSDGPTVYFEVSPLDMGLWTAGNTTFMDEIANMLGAQNIFHDVSGWAQISEEQVLERSPDIIVTVAMYYGSDMTPAQEILSRPGWQGVPAVQSGSVYAIESDSVSRPGPRLAQAAQELYSILYGE